MWLFQSISRFFQTLNVFLQYRWDGGPWGPGMMHWGMGWIWGIVMIVFWILLIALLIILIRHIIYRERVQPPEREEKESALDILKKRYARGEIDKEEFDRKKIDLS